MENSPSPEEQGDMLLGAEHDMVLGGLVDELSFAASSLETMSLGSDNGANALLWAKMMYAPATEATPPRTTPWISPLVDYIEPPGRMVAFATKALPEEVADCVSQLSSREVSLLTLCLIGSYAPSKHWRHENNRYAARAYVGLHEPPKARTDIRYGVYVDTALDRIQARTRNMSSAQAGLLLALVKAGMQNCTLDDKFYTPPVLQYEKWLSVRDDHFRQLFGDRSGRRAVDSLADITRRTRLNVALDSEETIAENVSAILKHHDAMARDPEGKAIFSLLSPDKDFERVAALTAQIICYWERGWRQEHKPTNAEQAAAPGLFAELTGQLTDPADIGRPVVQRVIETSAAVLEVLQIGYPSGKIGSARMRNLASFIAKRGPVDAARWMSGAIVREAYHERGVDPTALLRLTSPSARAMLATHHSNPLEALDRIYHHFETTLSYENLLTLTGWSEAKVKKFFPPYIRFRIATLHVGGNPENVVMNIVDNFSEDLQEYLTPVKYMELVVEHHDSEAKLAEIIERSKRLETLAVEGREVLGWSEDEFAHLFSPATLRNIAQKTDAPLDKIRRIATNYEEYLSTQNLMAEFGLTEEQCAILFPEYTRRILARRANCRARAKAVVHSANVLAREFDLPERLVANLAGQYSLKRCRRVAQCVSDAQASRPKKASKEAWAWVIAALPNASQEKRLQRLAAYFDVWSSLADPLSFDAESADGRSAYEFTPGATRDPADVVVEAGWGSDEFERLHQLAEQAGVSPQQLEKLLDAADTKIEDNAELAPLLQKLRRAAE